MHLNPRAPVIITSFAIGHLMSLRSHRIDSDRLLIVSEIPVSEKIQENLSSSTGHNVIMRISLQ